MHTSQNAKFCIVYKLFYLLPCLALMLLVSSGDLSAQIISFDVIKSKCRGSSFDSRVRLTVARFSVSTPDAQNRFGGELATMPSNGLQQTNCFRVLESITNADDLTGEIAFGQDARILAANGTHAGGSDITESSSSKISLRNAGSEMADYLLQTLCEIR